MENKELFEIAIKAKRNLASLARAKLLVDSTAFGASEGFRKLIEDMKKEANQGKFNMCIDAEKTLELYSDYPYVIESTLRSKGYSCNIDRLAFKLFIRWNEKNNNE